MPEAPRPLNEEERLAALERYRILDTPTEDPFEDVVALACALVDVPIALVSLVDRERQWFKARRGLDLAETERSTSFCAWVVYEDAPVVVADARLDERVRDMPVTEGEDGIRFYAGFPLRTRDGLVLGSLCAIDTQPRQISAEQTGHLQRLARMTMQQLHSRRAADDLAEALERVRVIGEMVPVCAYCHRIRDDEAFWGTLEQYLETQAGAQVSHGICPTCASKHFADI